ncbi:MAG: SDR family oxidoreductase [Anaerolineae bacterium]|nr:SDR family oxidoreductase [Anaerolineae bacterium]CAG0986962.1 3-oxoacyl-[acyl-carrier protein] reductase [Anaerolineae bacterium]
MDLGLRGKTAMVAAASKGLGFGVARALATEGARVAICSRDKDAIQSAQSRLVEETGAEIMATTCDVKSGPQLQAWVDTVGALWGGQVDALLVNAGGPPTGLFMELSDEQWQAAFELTLMSTIRLIRAVVPIMKEGGAILTITSSSIKEPIERLALSTVMRAGVAGLVKTLADELAPHRIRVNNLIPGRLNTDRVNELDQIAAQRSGRTFAEVRAGWEAKIPLKRLGSIDEFGRAAAFLLSPAASYITGASLRVDGGAMRSI